MKKLTKILILLSLFSFLNCFAEDPIDLLIRNKNPVPPEFLTFAFDQYVKADVGAMEIPDADGLDLKIAEKVAKLKDEQHRHFVMAAKYVTIPIVVGGGAFFSTFNPSTALTAPQWSFVANGAAAFGAMLVEKGISMVQESQDENLMRVSAEVFKEYNKKYKGAIKDHLHEGMSVDDIIKEMNEGISSPLVSKVYEGLSEEQQQRVAFQFAVSLKNLMAKGHSDIDKKIKESSQTLAEAISGIKKVETGLTNFKKLQEDRISKIADAQKKINDALKGTLEIAIENQDNVQKNTRDIEVIGELLYGHLTSKEKKAYLESHKDSKDYEKELKELDILILKEEICRTTVAIVGGANDLYAIADDLDLFGKNPKRKRKAQEVLKVANGIAGAADNYYKGNYLGAVSSLTGIFRKDRPDISGLRHEAIMGALDSMRQENYAYYQDLKEGQKLLSKQLKVYFEDLHGRLDAMKDFISKENQVIKKLIAAQDNRLSDLQELEMAKYNKGFSDCEYFLEMIEVEKSRGNATFVDGKFKDYDSFYHFFSNDRQRLPERLTSCLKFLDDNIEDIFHNTPFIFSQNYKREFKDDEKIDHLRRTARLFFTLPREERLRLYPMLTAPSKTLDDIDIKYKLEKGYDKYRQPFKDEDNKKSGILPHHERSAVDSYISPIILLRTFKVIIELSPYMEFLDRDNSRMRTSVEMASVPYQMAFARFLEGLIRKMDVAIIQQNLLAGDVAMPYFYKILHMMTDDYKDPAAKEKLLMMQKDLRLLLTDNRSLGTNFLRYAAREKFSRKSIANYLKDYELAYNGVMSGEFEVIGDGFYMEKMKPIVSSLVPSSINKKIKMVTYSDLEYGYYKIPEVNELTGEIKFSETAEYLIGIRTQAEKIRSDLLIYDSLDLNEKLFLIKEQLKLNGDRK